MTKSIRRAQRYQRKFLDRIAHTASLPPSSERDALLEREKNRYMASAGVKAARLRGMKDLRRKSDAAIAWRADRTNFETPCAQPVDWWLKEKTSGGMRRICNPPTKVRLGQLIAKDLITAQIRPDRCLYDWPGRGIHRCVADIGDALQTVGPVAFITDIRDCYERVRLDNLYSMNLVPTELIRSSIDPRHLSFRRSHRVSDDENYHMVTGTYSADPTGIMAGGPASSAIVVALIGNLSRSVPAEVWLGGYADDFGVVGAERGIVANAGEKLTRYLTGCPLGPSECKPPQTVDARDGFHFLGCFFWQFDDRVETCIPADRLESVIAKMIDGIENPAAADRDRDVDHHVRKALGPYPWAAAWQRDQIAEAAEAAWMRRSRQSR
jgi:hypothetical protein